MKQVANARPYRLSRPAKALACEPFGPLGRSAAVAALRTRFAALRPELELSPSGFVSSIEDARIGSEITS